MSNRVSKKFVDKPYLSMSKKLPVQCTKHPTYDAKTRVIPECLTCVMLFWLRWSGHRITNAEIGPSLKLR